MPRHLTRAEIAEVLRRWERGELTAVQVHDWGEAHYLNDEVEFADREVNDPEEPSAALEVVAKLDMLDHNLITPEDVPIYLEFLTTQPGAFWAGFARFEAALDRIDYDARRQSLRDLLPYSRLLQRAPVEDRGT